MNERKRKVEKETEKQSKLKSQIADNDFKIENRKPCSAMAGQLLSIPFDDNEATKRVVMHSAKRVIQQHKKEIQELAYK